MRMQLGAPDNTLLTPETYNQLFTMHGTTMIFLVVVPVLGGLRELPAAADDRRARRRVPAPERAGRTGCSCSAAWRCTRRMFFTPPEAGWFSYVPLSRSEYSPSDGQDAWIFMVHLTGLSSILGAINFIATIHNMRAPGMGWGRMPLFVWTILIYSYLIVLAISSLAATVTMLLLDRHFGTHFFDPTEGGSALLWQHLFWFFGHPEVYILVLPAFGDVLRGAAGVRPQADLRLQGDRGGHGRHRLPRPAGVGAPHVRHADVDRRARVLHALELPDRGADRRQDLQLAGDAVARHDRVPGAAAVRRRRHRHVRRWAASPASSSPSSRSTGS